MVAVALAFAGVAAGCGGGGELEKQTWPGAAEQVLTSDDVDVYPMGSPAYALLDWWRHTQNMDLDAYLFYYQKDLREELVRTGDAQELLPALSGNLRTSQPKVLETEISRDRATVWTRIERRSPVGLTKYVSTEAPQAFTMVRQEGVWRLTDDFFAKAVVLGEQLAQEQDGG